MLKGKIEFETESRPQSHARWYGPWNTKRKQCLMKPRVGVIGLMSAGSKYDLADIVCDAFLAEARLKLRERFEVAMQ